MTKNILETAKTLVYAVAIALVVRTFAYEPFNIPSGSMKPTLLVGDYLFVSKWAYGYNRHSFPFSLPLIGGRVLSSTPERGDVAVFKLPSDNRTDYIKRIVGLPGDEIQVTDGILSINGEQVDREPLEPFVEDGDGAPTVRRYVEELPGGRTYEVLDSTDNGRLDNTRGYTVPDGHVFAMGDNRDNSQDSRTTQVSFIPMTNLVGRAEIRFFSIEGSSSWWMPLQWPAKIRYDRILSGIE
ncbi:MAG: signal peptidase I [Geminicoccaceae bacterium]